MRSAAQGRLHFRKTGWVFLLVLLALSAATGSFARDRLSPSLEWRELRGDRFIVVFPRGYESQAGAVLETARNQFDSLKKLWNVHMRRHIRILLAPDSDVAGGTNSLFPYPTIRIDMAPPAPDSRLSGGVEPWLDKVLANELSRILLLQKASGFFRGLRRLVGPIPVTFPMMQYPLWLHEGLAVYSESLVCPGGRLNTPEYRQMFRHILSEGGFRHYLSIKGAPSRWPGPVTKFLYGAELFRFLADRYGRDSLQRLVTHLSRVPVSLSISSRFKHVFHLRFRALWKEFGRTGEKSPEKKIPLTPLTRSGWIKSYPVSLGGGAAAWFYDNYRSRPGIRVLDPATGTEHWLLRRWGVSSLAVDAAAERLVFSAPEVSRAFRWISDIYSCSIRGGGRRRWSRGASLFYPCPLPDGKGMLCVARDRDRFRLAHLGAPMERPELLSAEFAGLAHPRVSPDGRLIAVALKCRGMNWSIGVFDRCGRLKWSIQVPGGRCSVPRWLDNERVLFVLSGKKRTEPAMADIKARAVHVLDGGSPPEIRYIAPLSQGGLLVVYLNAAGRDLGVIPPRAIVWRPIPSRWETRIETPAPSRLPSGNGYRAGRDLLPRYISPDARYMENEVQTGARLSGRDVTGRFAFDTRLLYGWRTRKWNADVQFMLGCLFPRLNLTWRREHTVLKNQVRGDFIQTNAFLNMVAQFPLVVRHRYRWDLETGFHVNRIQDRRFFHSQGETVELTGFSLNLVYHSDQRYYDAFTRADGGRFAFMSSWDLPFGNATAVRSLALDWRRYISLGHPNVLALRLAAAHSWGDAPRVFYMGGSRAPAGAGLVEGRLFSLIRGFPAGYAAGFGGWQFNAETRLQLMKIERAFPIGPSFERLYLSLFCDMGNMWAKRLRLDPVVTWGAELGLLLNMRGALEVVVGVAWSRALQGAPAIYLRIGESF